LLLLSVWMWERFPIGRPKVLGYKPYEDHDNPLRLPTWAYKWDVVSEFSSDPIAAYKTYTNEFDLITAEQVKFSILLPFSMTGSNIFRSHFFATFQVDWEPYGRGRDFGYARTFELNPACLADQCLWQMRCPLICFWAVEHHMPQRVMRQFGLFQVNPPDWKDTDKLLHG
jgi:hypothetical protein